MSSKEPTTDEYLCYSDERKIDVLVDDFIVYSISESDFFGLYSSYVYFISSHTGHTVRKREVSLYLWW